MELKKLNPKEYGLTSTKAKEISKLFKPMLDKMEELESEYNHIASLPMDPETCKLAKEVRLKFVKVRTGTKEIHKELKAFYLNGGRFVDAWKNTQLFAGEQIEAELKAIENHYELIEFERKAALQKERLKEVHKYIDYEKDHATMKDPASIDLGGMDDGIYANFLAGMKLSYEQRKLAEQKEKEAAILKDKQDSLHVQRARDAAKYWDYMGEHQNSYFGDWEEMIWNDQMNEWKAADTKHHKEQEKIKTENKRLQKEAEKREEVNRKALAKEAAAREEVEKELQLKRETEQADEEARQAKLKQGDKDNWSDMKSDLEALKTAYSFKSKASKGKMEAVSTLLEKIIQYI